MTDNEIIKALECCANTEFISDCAKCEMFSFDCKDKLIEKALDLINRQKAEIKSLKDFIEKDQGLILKLSGVPVSEYNQKIKSEAINELVKRLKDRVVKKYEYTDIRVFNELDNLVKEMTEE